MDPYFSQQIKDFLRSHQFRLDTNKGQHFLVDEEALETIVDTAAIEETDHIVEIGPGIGILTRELLKRADSVTAIELDERLPPLLKQYIELDDEAAERFPRLEIIRGNALLVPFPETPYKIVANIPYHITSPLLRHACIESKHPPTSITLLIQREVAEKICDTESAGMLTIFVRLFGTPTFIRIVRPNSFLPPPAVDSAILHIEPYEKPLADLETIESVLKLTKVAFSQKRKMLSNSLGKLPGGMELLEKAGILPDRRPETLDIEEWLTLAKLRK
jgi:16S rRNA (adenine1518-N6/adenine1519-N6)-dimethyltransferase